MASIAEILSAKKKLQEAEKQYKKAPKKKPQYKDYLGRQERENLMILAAMVSKLEELIEDWLNHQQPRKRITYAKTSLTFLYKAMDSFFEGLTETAKKQQVYRLLKDLRQCNIYLKRGGER